MKKIGLLSDTHCHIPTRMSDFFKDCDEIWHAGDIGDISTADRIEELKYIRAVFGNIDGGVLRLRYPEYQFFEIEKVKVLMTHIGGYHGHYSRKAKQLILQYRPQLFISGHSHILKIIYDHKNQLLHINPGAAGNSGFHKKITLVRFVINGNNISDLEILDIDRRQ